MADWRLFYYSITKNREAFSSHESLKAALNAAWNKVLPDDQLLPHTYEFARRLAAAPGPALRLMKRGVYQGLRMDLRASLDMISSHQGVISTTHDHREAVAAFNEKRPPRFTDS
jgi:enoyl-CoA hydratase/carnithine racemase